MDQHQPRREVLSFLRNKDYVPQDDVLRYCNSLNAPLLADPQKVAVLLGYLAMESLIEIEGDRVRLTGAGNKWLEEHP
ncbi:MAG: hypothetical protein QM783_17285 [Phycisphaerales bacterium]